MAAIKTIIVADLVMSLDNVIGVAAAANGNIVLLVLGLVISIPLIIFGSTMLMTVMERFPFIITAGAGLLGYLGGEMLLTDPAVPQYLGTVSHTWVQVAGALGAALVVSLGLYFNKRHRRAQEVAAV